MTYSIESLRDQPALAREVADRVWRAWWKENGTSLAFIRQLVDLNLSSSGIPFCLVAHHNHRFMGTASVIACDMEQRPQYTPWVAAVWIEEDHRRQGIGTALIRAATETVFEQGLDSVYLCASPANSPYYKKLGWTQLERDVDGLNIFQLMRD